MNKEQLNAVIKLVIDKHFQYTDYTGCGNSYECHNKEKLQDDLVETLAVFLKDK